MCMYSKDLFFIATFDWTKTFLVLAKYQTKPISL